MIEGEICLPYAKDVAMEMNLDGWLDSSLLLLSPSCFITNAKGMRGQLDHP
jgi:hypothetical protein